MKKLICAILVLAAAPAFANDYGYYSDEENFAPTKTYTYDATSAIPSNTAKRDNYVGMRIHKNEHLAFDFDVHNIGDTTMQHDNIGLGIYVGNRLTDYIKIEFETAHTGASFDKYDTDFDYDIWANMLNVYMFHEFDNAVAPYAGLGLGMVGIWGDVNGNGIGASDFELDLSYQIMLGINFVLNERVDLNLGVKYQNYGKIAHSLPNNIDATTKIDGTEIYIGAAYKFGLK